MWSKIGLKKCWSSYFIWLYERQNCLESDLYGSTQVESHSVYYVHYLRRGPILELHPGKEGRRDKPLLGLKPRFSTHYLLKNCVLVLNLFLQHKLCFSMGLYTQKKIKHLFCVLIVFKASEIDASEYQVYGGKI